MTEVGELIAVLKACGADRFEPVRFRFIEALARRAATKPDALAQRLDARLRQLIDAHRAAFEQRGRAEPVTPVAAPPSPLAELNAKLAREPGTVDELQTLRSFRRTWARLSADRRVTQSLAKVPANAGPLNSQHLVHQALSLMRELSPAYLEHFVAHVDALLWLDQLHAAAQPQRPEHPQRTETRRKPARARDVTRGG